MTFIKTLIASASSLTIAACATVGPDYERPSTATFEANPLQADAAANAVETEPAQR